MNIIEDIEEFLKISKETVLFNLSRGVVLVKSCWEEAKPKTEEEVIKFYKNCKDYIFDLAAWHELPDKRKWDLDLIHLVKNKNRLAKTVLDYGCGIGSNGFLFQEAGFDVTIADLKSFSLDFAKFRIKKYNLPIKVIEIDKEKIENKFDVILCLDTLEHVANPIDLLKTLVSYLTPPGKLFLTITEPGPSHPMHFKMKDDFWDYIREIYREDIIGGIWHGKSG